MLLKFALRHLLRHWRLNLFVLLTLLLTVSLLAGLPMYTSAIADRSLRQTLTDAAPLARHLQVDGDLSVRLFQELRDILGPLYDRRVRLRVVDPIELVQRINLPDGSQRAVPEFFYMRFFSLDEYHNHVDLISGRLPEFVAQTNPLRLPTMEVVIGQTAAVAYGLNVGDSVASLDQQYKAEIVGIVAPTDPAADYWFENLLPFDLERIPGGNREDTVILSMILPPESMDAYFSFTETWRIFINWKLITLANATAVQTSLNNLLASQANVRLATGLVPIIDNYQVQLATARLSLFLLTAQSFLFVVYTLATITGFMLDQSRAELAMLAGRGFASRQITAIFAIEAVLMSLVALALGPLLARWLVGLWAQTVAAPAPQFIPAASWQLTLAGAVVGWLVITGSVYWASQRNLLVWQQSVARPPGRTGWQRSGVDLFLLALGGVAYWQLSQRGSFVLGAGQEQVADPLLLLGPSVLLISVALILLRLFPVLIRVAAWLTRGRRDLVLPLGLTRLARSPIGPGRVVLLVSISAALTLFASAFAYSVTQRQEEFALYFNGADMRVQLDLYSEAAAAQTEAINRLDGVRSASPVYRSRARLSTSSGVSVTGLFVDPGTLPQVTSFPAAVTRLRIPDIVEVLQQPIGRTIPAVVSENFPPQDRQIGDLVVYRIGEQNLTFEVRGIIRNFPRLSTGRQPLPFFVASLPALASQVDIVQLQGPDGGTRELWLDVPAEQQSDVAAALPAGATLLGTSQAQLQAFQSGLVAQETIGAFNLNALTLGVLSVLIFLLVHYFAAHARLFEFGVLRATGMATRQLLGLLTLEGVITLLLGVLSGTAIGLGLAYVMRPFMLLALQDAIGGGFVHAIIINWRSVFTLYGGLLLVYALALALMLAALLRAGIHRVMRIGDE